MSGPTCRAKRILLGLAYPKSSCEKCGSVVRAGWRCAEKEDAPLAAFAAFDAEWMLRHMKATTPHKEIEVRAWTQIKETGGDEMTLHRTFNVTVDEMLGVLEARKAKGAG